jgi:7-cyano-7-deazaguanine synthase
MKKDVEIIVLSGGLDSVTLAHKLVNDGRRLQAIHVNGGFPESEAERALAKRAAFKVGIPIEIVDVPGVFSMASGFLATGSRGPRIRAEAQQHPAVRSAFVVYVPVWLSIVTYYALLGSIREINVGFIKEQFDCNPELTPFLDSWVRMTGPLNPDRSLSISAPFSETTKAGVAELGKALSVNIADTWSCYRGSSVHCGECGGCLSRRKAFTQSGVKDPTEYLSHPPVPDALFYELR